MEKQFLKSNYLDRGFAFYIFARKAVKLGVVPVGGVLFHNAVEMLLRSGMAESLNQKQIHSRFFRHNLEEIWVEFKKIYGGLDRWNFFIKEQNQWKELKYPESGYAVFTGVKRMQRVLVNKNKKNAEPGQVSIEINLEDMDEFIFDLVKVININIEWIKIQVARNKELLDFYLEDNEHKLFS